MHLTVLACDLDGTLADHGHIAPETWEALRHAKNAGLALLLVTGRTLQTFAPEGPYAELFEAIIAEDGAVVYFPRRDDVVLPFGHLAPALLRRLEDRGVPFERGMAIAATHVPHDEAILAVLRELGGGASVEYNRGAVMVLPPGATKGTGLQYALHELGYSLHNVVACGDAENDRSLFEVAELAVAVGNAAPDIQALADVVLDRANGTGVRTLITNLLNRQLPTHRLRAERCLVLGQQGDGAPLHLDPFTLLNGNLGIVGASGGGKSWLAGLLAEEVLKHGYQVCIIDPEGDYRNLRAFPHTLLVGGPEMPLPPVVDLITLSEYADISLVIDLSAYPIREQSAYVLELLHGLWCLRAQRGRPHWFLIDEIQNFCPPEGGALTTLLLKAMQEGGFSLVSYRPSLVAPALLDMVNHWLLTRVKLPAERAVLQPLLAQYERGAAILEQLPTLPLGQAYLCTGARSCPPPHQGILSLRARPRAVPHIRHLHKYLRAALPEPKRFYFCDPSGRHVGHTAASLWEFRDALAKAPLDSLQYHLQRGDFESWVREVLRDSELARRLRKIARRDLQGDMLQEALISVVIDRYEELDSLI